MFEILWWMAALFEFLKARVCTPRKDVIVDAYPQTDGQKEDGTEKDTQAPHGEKDGHAPPSAAQPQDGAVSKEQEAQGFTLNSAPGQHVAFVPCNSMYGGRVEAAIRAFCEEARARGYTPNPADFTPVMDGVLVSYYVPEAWAGAPQAVVDFAETAKAHACFRDFLLNKKAVAGFVFHEPSNALSELRDGALNLLDAIEARLHDEARRLKEAACVQLFRVCFRLFG